MNNEPVAWRIGMQTPNDGIVYLYVDKQKDMDFLNKNSPNSYEPLYTHPAKTLTDEEIDYCWNHSHGNTPWMKQKAFARAILRKAQEK